MYRLPLLVLILVALAACGPLATVVTGRASLPVEIVHPGFTVQDGAKRLKDVVTYRVTLVHAGSSDAVAGVGTNPVNLTAPTRTTSFSGMGAGTYEILVDALDGGGASLVEGGGPVRSSNSATVGANGAVDWSDSNTSFAVKVALADATTGNLGAGTVTVNASNAPFASPTEYGLILVNNATLSADAKAVTPFTQPAASPPVEVVTVSDVQVGDTSGTTPTHEVWYFQADRSGSPWIATPAKRQPTAAAVSGAFASVAVTVPAITAVNAANGAFEPADGQIALDAADNLYFIPKGTTQIWRAQAGQYSSPSLITSPPALKAMTVDDAGNIYYTEGTNIVRRVAPTYASSSTVVTAANVGVLAVDGDRNLYWAQTTAPYHVMKAVFNGTNYEPPVDTGITVGPSPLLAVDAFGNVYFVGDSDGYRNVERSALSRNRTTYKIPVIVAACPDTITDLAVDRAGNAYHVNANEAEWIWMTPHGSSPGDRYLVAGTLGNTPADVLPGYPPLATELNSVRHLAVGPSGRLVFTSMGQSDRLLRMM